MHLLRVVCTSLLFFATFAERLHHRTTRDPFRLAVMVFFKNEDAVIQEFLEHYYQQGARYFVLIDNNSTNPFDASSPGPDAEVHVISEPTKYSQVPAINNVGLPLLRKAGIDVVLSVDMDEFMWSKDGRTIAEVYKETFENQADTGSVCTGWTLFGSSGHIKQPTSVRLGFTWASNKTASHPHTKCASLVNAIKSLDLHYPHLIHGKNIVNLPVLQLNHYCLQSWEWFQEVKMKRGDATTSVNVRNENYFESYNAISSEHEDYGLFNQVLKIYQNKNRQSCKQGQRKSC